MACTSVLWGLHCVFWKFKLFLTVKNCESPHKNMNFLFLLKTQEDLTVWGLYSQVEVVGWDWLTVSPLRKGKRLPFCCELFLLPFILPSATLYIKVKAPVGICNFTISTCKILDLIPIYIQYRYVHMWYAYANLIYSV